MRSLWSGTIGFGLVNIPIKLFAASQESDLDLDMLDKKDYANIHFKRVNEHTGKEVSWANIVKGYKLNGKYVIITPEDLEKVSPEKTKMIDIREFIFEKDIDPILYEKAYYLEPAESGKKAYVLLREALKKSKKVGMGSFVLRNKEHLCILKNYDKLILLQTLRFPEEIRVPDAKNIPASQPSASEIKMALNLIAQLTSKKPNLDKYKDTYNASLMSLIRKKGKGVKIAPSPLKVVHRRDTQNLMDQLKASLSSGKKKAS